MEPGGGVIGFAQPFGEVAADGRSDASTDRIHTGETAYDEPERGDRIDLCVLLDLADIGPHPVSEAAVRIDRRTQDLRMDAGFLKGQRLLMEAGRQIEQILLAAARRRAECWRPFGAGQPIEQCDRVLQAVTGDRRAIGRQPLVEPAQQRVGGVRWSQDVAVEREVDRRTLQAGGQDGSADGYLPIEAEPMADVEGTRTAMPLRLGVMHDVTDGSVAALVGWHTGF